MPYSVDGKSAIVTGAGGGINLQFAKKLLEAGANVLIADLYLMPEAEQIIEQYKNKPQAVFQKTDVSSWSDLDLMFKTAHEHFGDIDIVCPGAGVFEPPWSNFWVPPGSAPSKDDPVGNGYKVLDINLTHPIRLSQMAISHFLNSSPPASVTNPKRIVFIASVAGEIAFLATPLYHASKFGVIGFLRSISGLDEYLGIRANGVAPGIVKTRLWLEDETKVPIVTDKATGQLQVSWTTPEEVADAMMALVRDDEIDNGRGEKIPIKSGTVLEVANRSVRDVPMLGNAGPDFTAEGMILSDMPGAYATILGSLQQPGWGKN